MQKESKVGDHDHLTTGHLASGDRSPAVGHTPGPWTAHDLTGKPVNDPSIMAAKHCVATAWINDIARKEAVANARLIAAAPDLLAAVLDVSCPCPANGTPEGVFPSVEDCVGDGDCGCNLGDAVKKATGAQS